MWFNSISMASVRADVDDSPLNFTALVNSVRYGHFFQILPPAFAKQDKSNKHPNLPRNVNNGLKEDGNKRQNKNREILNTSPFPEFKLLPDKTWATTFASKKVGRVKWEDQTLMCPRWFITSRCVDNCFHSPSHVKKEDVPKAKLTAFENFMKTCRDS